MAMRPRDGTMSLRYRLNSLTGRELAAISGDLRFLHSPSSAAQVRVGRRIGPLAGGGIPLEDTLPPMFEERLLRLIDDMALIQREVCADLRIPDLDQIDVEAVKTIRIAAALLRGGTVRTEYTAQPFTMPGGPQRNSARQPRFGDVDKDPGLIARPDSRSPGS
jgi:hypothetical protein